MLREEPVNSLLVETQGYSANGQPQLLNVSYTSTESEFCETLITVENVCRVFSIDPFYSHTCNSNFVLLVRKEMRDRK